MQSCELPLAVPIPFTGTGGGTVAVTGTAGTGGGTGAAGTGDGTYMAGTAGWTGSWSAHPRAQAYRPRSTHSQNKYLD